MSICAKRAVPQGRSKLCVEPPKGLGKPACSAIAADRLLHLSQLLGVDGMASGGGRFGIWVAERGPVAEI